MVKELKVDKINGIVVLEITKNDLINMMDSVNNMADKQQRTLLENLPSEESDRRKLDDYNALKEDLKDRKSTRLNSSHMSISYAVFCLKYTATIKIYTLSLHDALPIFKVDKINGIVVLEITKNDLINMMDSVNNMADKQQRTLLENLPSEESDRRKLDDYNALKEDL